MDVFNPNAPSKNPNSLFGLPQRPEDSKLVVIPVPWEVTTSGNAGTANAPKCVLMASHQVDVFDQMKPDLWEQGLAFDEFPTQLITLQLEALKCIKNYRALNTAKIGMVDNPKSEVLRKAINECCEQVNFWVKRRADKWLEENKIVATLGGDHSTCYGLVHALAERFDDISVLQIDAHADLREAYEGLSYSHASVMYNISKLLQVRSLTSVGVRDLCEEEFNYIESHPEISCYYDQQIRDKLYSGTSWKDIVDTIVESLGDNVYLSFDVDGLTPELCPRTGTPVPGGLDFEQSLYLIKAVVDSGRKIIGFDISECGNGEWDGNVAARLLWRIFGLLS